MKQFQRSYIFHVRVPGEGKVKPNHLCILLPRCLNKANSSVKVAPETFLLLKAEKKTNLIPCPQDQFLNSIR